MKHEWRKDEKSLYLPKDSPQPVTVPMYPYIAIHGEGDPNQADFQRRVELLFSVAYGVKMAPRKGIQIDGYFEYTVYPLEGIWDYSDHAKKKGLVGKEHLVYTLMIRQPAFVTQKLFERVVTLKKYDDTDPLWNQLEFITHEDGECVQVLHVGPFDDEPESFAKIETYLQEHGLQRTDRRHREIYLSDFRNVAPEQLQTVLRVFVKKP